VTRCLPQTAHFHVLHLITKKNLPNWRIVEERGAADLKPRARTNKICSQATRKTTHTCLDDQQGLAIHINQRAGGGVARRRGARSCCARHAKKSKTENAEGKRFQIQTTSNKMLRS
jgi:hypothetical protein